MKFELLKASNRRFKKELEINTLEDLWNIYEKYENDLVVNFKDNQIIIYDDYME